MFWKEIATTYVRVYRPRCHVKDGIDSHTWGQTPRRQPSDGPERCEESDLNDVANEMIHHIIYVMNATAGLQQRSRKEVYTEE